MKKTILILFLIGFSYLLQAQRFFYVDPSGYGADLINYNLKHASQFLAKSQMDSDCIIKTESISSPGKTIVKITMQDSVSFKTIFEASEEYNYKASLLSQEIFQRFCFKVFVDKYNKQLVLSAKRNNCNTYMLLLKEKKDKT